VTATTPTAPILKSKDRKQTSRYALDAASIRRAFHTHLELMCLLVDIEQLDWKTAWDFTTRTFACTNHTVIDLHKEMEVTGIAQVETIAQ
jgi:hypothetical protein